MRALAWLVVCGGCSLYFGDPSPEHHPIGLDGGAALPDAFVVSVDAAPSCPLPNTSAQIMYPLDGATNVPQPVPIQYTVWHPLDEDEGIGIYLADANGDQVPLAGYYDSDCSSPQQNFPTDPETSTQCYTNLGSGAAYTWHIWVVCYGLTTDTILDIATSTFTTAM
jgi:hypothetical protein